MGLVCTFLMNIDDRPAQEIISQPLVVEEECTTPIQEQ